MNFFSRFFLKLKISFYVQNFFLNFLYQLPGQCLGNFPAVPKKRLIQFQQVPYQGNDRQPLLFADGTDPVLEPFMVQSNDLEHESNALSIEAIVRAGGNDTGMREPGAAHAARQRDNEGKTVSTSYNNSWPDSPLFMPFCV
jgi:hypothetical protein